jgi:hypothetical protein
MQIFCAHCNYCLDGIQERRCSECGRDFNPTDPTTFSCGSRKYANIIAIIILSYPLFLLSSIYATWLTAFVSLGRIPRPSLDDPKSINVFVSAFLILTGSLYLLMPVSFVGFIIALIIRKRRDFIDRHPVASWALLGGSWGILIAVLAIDPGRVLYWMMD